LKKEYLQDGSVLFTDECTQEQALAAPDQNQAAASTPRATR
jgi:hypothetical protein